MDRYSQNGWKRIAALGTSALFHTATLVALGTAAMSLKTPVENSKGSTQVEYVESREPVVPVTQQIETAPAPAVETAPTAPRVVSPSLPSKTAAKKLVVKSEAPVRIRRTILPMKIPVIEASDLQGQAPVAVQAVEEADPKEVAQELEAQPEMQPEPQPEVVAVSAPVQEEIQEELAAEPQAVVPQPVAPSAPAAPRVEAAPQPSATVAPTSAGASTAASLAPTPGLPDGVIADSQLGLPLKHARPYYPLSDKMRRYEGSTVILYTVKADGSVSNLRVHQSSGSKAMDDSAMKALALFKYRPVGQTVEVMKTFAYRLRGEANLLPSRLRSGS